MGESKRLSAESLENDVIGEHPHFPFEIVQQRAPALGIPIGGESKGANGALPPAGNSNEALLERLRKAILIVIDEMSMVSMQLLYQIEATLSVVWPGKEATFGGIGFVIFGDLQQLPSRRHVADKTLVAHNVSLSPAILEASHHKRPEEAIVGCRPFRR